MNKVQLLMNVPVADKHGMTKGRVLEILSVVEHKGRGQQGMWVMGNAGEQVKLQLHEYRIMTDEAS